MGNRMKFHFLRTASIGCFLLLFASAVSGADKKQSLGSIVDVIVKELPYFDKSGQLLGVVEAVNPKEYIGKAVLENAPRGLIGLNVNGEIRYFRSVNFTISDGALIKCPEVIQSKSSSSKEPVVSGIGKGNCKKDMS